MTATSNLAPAEPGPVPGLSGAAADHRRTGQAVASAYGPAALWTPTFRRVAAAAAVGAALTSIAYTITFAVVVRRGSTWAQWASSSVLLAGSLLSLVVVVGIAAAIARRAEPELGMVAGILGVAGALGAAT